MKGHTLDERNATWKKMRVILKKTKPIRRKHITIILGSISSPNDCNQLGQATAFLIWYVLGFCILDLLFFP
jgi:hypothetical protein